MEIDPYIAVGIACISIGIGMTTFRDNPSIQKVASIAQGIMRQIGEDFALFFRVEATPLSKRKIDPNPGFIRRVFLYPIKNAFENIAGIFFLIYALYVIRKRRNSA